MSLSERIAERAALQHRAQAHAMMMAGPKIRACEHLERRLREAGIEASAEGDLVGGAPVVHVLAYGDPSHVVDVLCAHSLFFDRHQVPGFGGIHYDVSVGGYNTTLIVIDSVLAREVA